MTSIISRLITFYIIAFISTIPSILKLLAGVFGIRLGNKLNTKKKLNMFSLVLQEMFSFVSGDVGDDRHSM